MRFGKLTALTGVLIIALALVYGCSDDKTTSTPTVTYGSIDDPNFVPVKAQIDSALSVFVGDILVGFDNLYASPGDTVSIRAELLMPPFVVPDPNAGLDTLIAIYENGWHYVYATYVGNVYNARVIDSIQFQIDGTPTQDPSYHVDQVHFINNWEFTAINPDVSHVDFTGRNDFDYTNLDQSTATINGTIDNNVEGVYIGVDTTMTNAFTFSFTATNVQVPKTYHGWKASCPTAGTLDMTMTHTFSWTNAVTEGNGATEWTIQVTFNDGTATVTASNSVATWRYEYDVCQVSTN